MSRLKCELIDIVEQFVKNIRFTRTCVDVWLDLINKKSWKKEILIAPWFFEITKRSLQRTIFIETYKLYEERKDSMNMKRLFKESKNFVATSVINSYETDLSSLKPTIDNLMKHRHGFAAHHGQHYFVNPGKLTTDWPIAVDSRVNLTLEQLKNKDYASCSTDIIDLLDWAFNACVGILNILTGDSKEFSRYVGDYKGNDVHELFSVLSKHAWGEKDKQS